ncbi:hypothetical protein F5X99DRAFT_369489 [Biscogniauxia marginata]|nr:hypothetical protein F5X99DRAFT_369489 [Biscogniauxia marginata]
MADAPIRTGLLSYSRQRYGQTLSRMAGSSRHRFYPLKYPPNRILALYLRCRKDEQRKRYAAALAFAARQRSERLPIVTLQMLLRKQDLSGHKELSDALHSISPARWRDTLNSVAARGWAEDNLNHWVWLLSGENGDDRIARFLSTEEPKPIFLLLLLFRRDEIIRKPESLVATLEYVSKHYITIAPGSSAPAKMLTPHTFLILLSRLILHIQRLAPRSIVTLARFAKEYIKEIPKHYGPKAYRYQCLVFNTALQLFKRQASNQPLVNMEFNWRAQKLLLALSEGLEKPLVINKRSYRAIRQVLIGLKRSAEEKMAVRRSAKSWPPYRQDFDGVDARRMPEDDYTRSIKAGLLMAEAGYEPDNYDLALNTLGGMNDRSPTIPTRSQPPKEWKGEKKDWNLHTRWAMSIRATRNPQEAWRALRAFADQTSAPPNIQVYGEMFIKLLTENANPDLDPLPGDLRENFPVHDANYSPYELARLTPPTVAELYDQMISQGIKPEGHYLYTLVTHAGSVEEGLRYLTDSNIDPVSISQLGLFKEPSHRALQRIPLLAFRSYIHLLCRIQPARQGQQRLPTDDLMRIRHAMKLVSIRLIPDTTEGATFRPPWYIILRALARPHIAVKNGTETENDIEALSMFIDVLRAAQRSVGLDPEFLILFCRVVQKAASSRLKLLQETQPTLPATEEPLLIPSAKSLSRALQTMFSSFTTPAELSRWVTSPMALKQPVGPVHLHGYMRALAFLDDQVAMMDLATWILDHWEYIEGEIERMGYRGRWMMARTMCAFHAFAGPSLSDKQKQELDLRMDRITASSPMWRWPTEDEVDYYVGVDKRGASQRLRKRVLAKSWHTAARQYTEEQEDMAAA